MEGWTYGRTADDVIPNTKIFPIAELPYFLNYAFVASAIDNRNLFPGIFFDLCKAFDHTILIKNTVLLPNRHST